MGLCLSAFVPEVGLHRPGLAQFTVATLLAADRPVTSEHGFEKSRA